MTGYTKTKTFTTGATIIAQDFTTEFNNVSVAFDESTGHTHNGDVDSGAYVPLISSADTFTKITTTEATDQLNFYTNVSGAAALQLSFKDGVIEPGLDSDVDIGTTAKRFKDLYVDSATVTADITANGQVLLSDTSTIKFGTDGSNYFEIYKATGAAGGSFIKEVGGGAITLQGQNGYLRSDTKAVASWGSLDIALKYNDANRIVTTDAGVTVTGTLSATSATIAGTASFEDQIIITSNDSQLAAQPTLTLRSNENGSIDNQLGEITFQGHNNQQVDQTYAYMRAESPVITDDQEEGKFKFFVRKTGNAYANTLTLDSAGIDVIGAVKGDSLTIDNGADLTTAYINSATGAAILTVKSTYEGGTEWQNVGAIEVGGHDKAYIDLKEPDDDDTDLRLLHDGDGSLTAFDGDLFLQTSSSNSSGKVALRNGANTKLETTATGIDVTGDVAATTVTVGDGTSTDLKLYKDGSDNCFIEQRGNGGLDVSGIYGKLSNESNQELISWDTDNAALSWRGATGAGLKLFTSATGINVTGTVTANGVTLGDDEKAFFGAGNDLQIFHSGSDSFIKDAGTGILSIQTNGDYIALRDSEQSLDMARFTTNGSAALSYTGATGAGTKLETTATGIDVTGLIDCNNSLQIRSTGSSLDAMPDLYMSNLEGAAAAQNLGMISFRGYNLATTPAIKNYADVYAQQVVVTEGGEEGKLVFDVLGAGAKVEALQVTKDGIDVTGTVTASEGVLIPEGKKLRLGSETDSAGLDIYESTDGDSLINQYGDGNLIVKGQNILLRNNSDQTLISTIANTAQLFHRNGDNEGLKLETTNSGIDVTGTVEANAFSGTGSVAITDFIDDDTFGTATDTNVPTAESVKAYVDTTTAAASAGDITSVVAGDGLTGGATSGVATVTVVGGVGIVANADDVALDLNELTTSEDDADGDFFAVVDTDGAQKKLTKANIALSGMNNDSGWTSNAGTVTAVTVGTGLDVSNGTTAPALSLDFTEFSDMTADVEGTTEVILNNAGTESRKAISEINLSTFNNDLTFANTDTTYTAGTGLTLSAGDEFSVNEAQTQITSVGTLSALNVTGDLTLNGSYPTGTENTFVGAATRTALTGTAVHNVGVGSTALGSLTTGDDNSAIGSSALASLTTGSDNIALGKLAGSSSTSGSNNIAIGKEALYTGVSASNNAAIGNNALYALTSGNYNVAMGVNSGRFLTSGAQNVFLGYASGKHTTDANFIVAVGTDAGRGAAPDGETVNYTGGDNNVAIGYNTLFNQTTGHTNVAIGREALEESTTGTNLVAIGKRALGDATTATSTIAIGLSAGEFVTTSTVTTALGMYACRAISTGNFNTGIGWRALSGNAGAGNRLTGDDNLAIGKDTLSRLYGASEDNLAIGNSAANLTDGSHNVLIGHSCGQALTTASYQTIIGNFSGNSSGLDVRTSSTSRLIIATAGTPVVVSTASTFDIMTGATTKAWSTSSGGVRFSSNSGTSTMNWSRHPTTTIGVSAARYYHNGTTIGSIVTTTTGTSYVTSSDYRLKENVSPLTGSIDRLKSLKPCTFNFLTEPSRNEEGFIAHEVQEVVSGAVNGTKDAVDEDGNIDAQGLDTSRLVPLLTSALQEAVEKIEQLEERISALES